jgi:hypothetical protein
MQRFGNETVMHSLPLFEGSDSLKTPLPVQRDAIIRYLAQNVDVLQLGGGFNFVAHSQGALLARSIVQVGGALRRVVPMRAAGTVTGHQLEPGCAGAASEFVRPQLSVDGRSAAWAVGYVCTRQGRAQQLDRSVGYS